MNSSVTKRTNCRLCQEDDLEPALELAPSPIADDYVPANRAAEKQRLYPLDLHICRSCGHVQMLNVVDPEALFRNYTYRTSVSAGLGKHFRTCADSVIKRLNVRHNALVVDIGSNDGTLLQCFKESGFRVLGVDPARNIAQKATESGIETLPTFFTSDEAQRIRGKHGEAMLITANNVFAHADNLADMLIGVRELLSDDGIFAFEVSYLMDIVDRMLFDTIYHEHLSYHTVKPLQSFFQLHGMSLFDIEHLTTKGGSLRGFAGKHTGSRPTSPLVSELVALERARGFDQPRVYRSFGERLARTKAAVRERLEQLKANGKTIAGYGASATVTTLIYHFGLGEFLDYLFDDNPGKQYSLSPGHHLQVLPSEQIYEKKPDHIVVLAWNYVEPIVRRHNRFLTEGGHFIVPLPEFKII